LTFVLYFEGYETRIIIDNAVISSLSVQGVACSKLR